MNASVAKWWRKQPQAVKKRYTALLPQTKNSDTLLAGIMRCCISHRQNGHMSNSCETCSCKCTKRNVINDKFHEKFCVNNISCENFHLNFLRTAFNSLLVIYVLCLIHRTYSCVFNSVHFYICQRFKLNYCIENLVLICRDSDTSH